jgi:hypothetical protein
MERAKIAAIVFILSAGIIASYVIFKNTKPKYDSAKSGLSEENPTSSISQNPIKWLGKRVESGFSGLAGKLSDLVSGSDENNIEISLPEDIDFEKVNLTELVAKSSFTQMKNLDQGGKDPFNIDPNDPANQEFWEKAIASVSNPHSLFIFSVDNDDLKISNNNSKEAKAEYLDAIGKIMLANINNDYRNPGTAMQAFANNFDVSGIKRIEDVYFKTLNSVLNTRVPSDYLVIHKQYLVFLKKAKAVYAGIAGYDTDPVKAALSAQLVTQIAEEDLAIKERYADKVLENLQSKS